MSPRVLSSVHLRQVGCSGLLASPRADRGTRPSARTAPSSPGPGLLPAALRRLSAPIWSHWPPSWPRLASRCPHSATRPAAGSNWFYAVSAGLLRPAGRLAGCSRPQARRCRLTIELDEPAALLAVGDRNGGLLRTQGAKAAAQVTAAENTTWAEAAPAARPTLRPKHCTDCRTREKGGGQASRLGGGAAAGQRGSGAGALRAGAYLRRHGDPESQERG